MDCFDGVSPFSSVKLIFIFVGWGTQFSSHLTQTKDVGQLYFKANICNISYIRLMAVVF